jgi:hemolysin activation/secretion protein
MRRILTGLLTIGSSIWGASLCPNSTSPKSACYGWESLQQLRTLIPERVWEQDFVIQVQNKECSPDLYGYFLRSTFAGENVRLLDRYQEFQTSPFWDTPPMLDGQKILEKEILASACGEKKCSSKNTATIDGAKLGAIHSEGSRYFASNDLIKYIRTKPGQAIDLQDIVQDLAWMNQNPFRRTNAIFKPGALPGTMDLDLVTTDRWPYRVYTGADNTGTISTERNRLIFGFDFGKTNVQDSQVAYQFTCSPNWNHFYAHTISARIPCPWRHVLLLYGGYSQVEPELNIPGQKEKGTSWQADLRYRIPIITNTHVLQEFVFGYDFKETDTLLKEHKEKILDSVADINQFMLGYELGYQSKNQKVTLVAELYGNPGGMTTKNHTVDYQQLRQGAKAEYLYGKLVHAFATKLPYGWWFTYDFSGQYSSANLLPSEQFVLTGYNAVRGFEERILSVDNAALLNVSIELPHVSPISWFSHRKVREDDLYLLAFFDCGAGTNHKNTGDSHKLKTLASVGPGIRYQFSRYVTGRLDYGYQLWHRGFENFSNSRYNFGLIVSY